MANELQVTPSAESHAMAAYGVNISGMPLGLAIMFNDKLYERIKDLARFMAKADGITPPHLINKSEACYAVITRAITWKLDPYAVAQSTYQTPGGRVGYEGKLVQAILENSGSLIGPVAYEHFGPWENVVGKFTITKSDKGKDYAKPTWTRADAKGCGVIVSAQVRGEPDRRVLPVNLDEMFPLNSTLWATRPKQQICYTACRAFANIIAPGIMFGTPFDVDPSAGDEMRDVTPPRPQRGDTSFSTAETEKPAETVTDVTVDPPHDAETGEIQEGEPDKDEPAIDAYAMGREAAENGRSLRSYPREWTEDPINGHKRIDEFQDAWRARDNEIRLKGK